MSYDLEIWSIRPIEARRIEGRTWQIVVEEPAPIEPEDLPDSVKTTLPAASFLCRIELEGDAHATAYRKLTALATKLAKEAGGVVIDLQLDAQPLRAAKPERSVIVMSWWWVGNHDLNRTWAAALLTLLEKQLPAAMPHRYGPYMPLRHKLADTGVEGFLDFWEKEKTFLIWKAKDPVRDVSVPARLYRGPSRQGFFFPSLRLSIDRRELERDVSRAQLSTLWSDLTTFTSPVYGDVRTLRDPQTPMTAGEFIEGSGQRHPIESPCLRGLPPGPVHAWVAGEPYRSLLKDRVRCSDDGKLLSFSTGDWRSPAVDPGFPAELVQPSMARFVDHGTHCDYRAFPETVTEYAQVWPFDPPFAP